MSKVLRNIVRETLRQLSEAKPKERPTPTGQTGPRGTWGGRRVYDKKTGEEFDVVNYIPDDPSSEVEHVILRSRSDQTKKKKVSYDEFLGDFKRHSGQPVRTPNRRPSRKVDDDEEVELRDVGPPPLTKNIRAWVGDELSKQGATQKQSHEYPSSVATYAKGPVGIDPETGEMIRLRHKAGALEPNLDAGGRGRDIEVEKAIDKINLVSADENLYKKMSQPYLEQYKDGLLQSIVKAQKEIKRYRQMLLVSNTSLSDEPDLPELADDQHTDEELEWLKNSPPPVIFAAVWELPDFHELRGHKLGIPPEHISTISSIAATGQLSLKTFGDEKTQKAIREDPGFVTWLDKTSKGKFWNEFRSAMEQKGLYRGQF